MGRFVDSDDEDGGASGRSSPEDGVEVVDVSPAVVERILPENVDVEILKKGLEGIQNCEKELEMMKKVLSANGKFGNKLSVQANEKRLNKVFQDFRDHLSSSWMVQQKDSASAKKAADSVKSVKQQLQYLVDTEKHFSEKVYTARNSLINTASSFVICET